MRTRLYLLVVLALTVFVSCNKNNDMSLTGTWWGISYEYQYYNGSTGKHSIKKDELGVVFKNDGTLYFTSNDGDLAGIDLSDLAVEYEIKGNDLYISDLLGVSSTRVKLSFSEGSMIWEMNGSSAWWFDDLSDNARTVTFTFKRQWEQIDDETDEDEEGDIYGYGAKLLGTWNYVKTEFFKQNTLVTTSSDYQGTLSFSAEGKVTFYETFSGGNTTITGSYKISKDKLQITTYGNSREQRIVTLTNAELALEEIFSGSGEYDKAVDSYKR